MPKKKLSLMRRLLKTVHPEGIPWPGATVYNKVSSTKIFQRHYEFVARDIVQYGTTGNLLDIGTGPGWLLLRLHDEAPRLNLTGTDVSSAMASAARRNMAAAGLSRTINVEECNVISMPFDDEAFHFVVSTGTIHHWKDPTTGLGEIYRVLKPGGYALMYDVVSDTPKTILAGMTNEFGRLRIALFWIHAFEEPFYSQKEFSLLARGLPFIGGRARFVGILCCLVLRKPPLKTGEMRAGQDGLIDNTGSL